MKKAIILLHDSFLKTIILVSHGPENGKPFRNFQQLNLASVSEP
jgi:hypothetical protein